jgi:RimJ/RimL family protein N-acetyltransferase
METEPHETHTPPNASKEKADHSVTIRGTRILLRRVQERDKRDRLAAGRDAEAVRMYGGDDRNLAPFTGDDAERWYLQQLHQRYAWVIEVDRRCIGGISLHSVVPADRRAQVAIGIHVPEMRNRGYGTEAMRLVLRFAFEQMGLHRVGLRVLEYNRRAIASYEKCGFGREGIERESGFVAGEWYSDVMMGILEHEYRTASRTWD